MPWRIRSAVFALANSATNKLYVGLLQDTNLGAPLPSDTATSATWDATVSVISYDGATVATPANETFKLEINYGGTGDNTLAVMGTEPSVGSLGAFTIDGKFTRNGVIYGTVNFATNAGTGTLTGLIGDAGVVGIFKSDAETGATSASIAYVGGFTAAPPAPALPDATFATWADSFATGEPNEGTLLAENALLNDADNTSTIVTESTPTSGTNSAHFIRGTATGIDGIYTPFAPARVGGLHLTGDTDNGIAFGFINTDTDINDHATGLHFAGLLSGADVGVPINAQTAAFWTGSIGGFINGQAISTTNFRLRVGFNGTVGSITNSNALEDRFGTQSPVSLRGRFFAFNGTFNADGVLTGTVESSANFSFVGARQAGTFNGIVGQAGVLGVFKSDADTTTSGVQYAGGFAVVPSGTPTAFIDEVAVPNNNNGGGGGGGGEVTGTTAYQAWATSFDTGNAQAVRGDTLRASNYTAPAGASVDFIRLNDSDDADEIANNIVATNFESFSENTLRLNDAQLSSDAGYNSGAVFGYGFDDDSNYQLYAGLLPTTDLGAPITDGNKDGVWTGKLGGVDIAAGAPFLDINFHLKVDFISAGGTVKSSSAAGVPGSVFVNKPGVFYTLDFSGTFDAMGVMSGDITGGFGGVNGTFNGLIGQDGAVGVFKGINPAGSQGYVGGFQVKPPSN